MKNQTKSDYKWFVRRISGSVIVIDDKEAVNCGQNWTQIRHKNGDFTVIPNIQIMCVEGELKKRKKR